MYQTCSNEDEFEPRITPKPAPKLDSFTVPSVPEVSLIFDKPLDYKSIEHVDFQSPPTDCKTLTYKNNNSLNTHGSYAAWKQQNYSYKPSNNNDSTNSPKPQFGQNYDSQCYAKKSTTRESPKESQRNNHGLIKDTSNCIRFEEREAHRRRDSNSYEHSYQVCENNIAQCNNTMQQCDHVSPVSHAVRPCKNTDSYDFNKKECFPLLYDKQLITNNSKQVPFNDSTNESTLQNQPINPNMLQRSDYQLPHYLGQQYPYFNMNSYPFPQFHPYSPHNTDNQETMKNLLQIINSQNDQIKSLQIQVDRLLKMQEENLKERKKCSCAHPVQQQNNQFFANSNDIDHNTLPKSIKRNAGQNELPKDRRKDSSDDKNSELIPAEAQAKKTFMEQKVSIGVMTSFEFTVQNSPFTVDIDDSEKPDSPQKNENLKLCNGIGIRDNNESLKRYKNSFTRMPSGQLENIVEDSESYMSSSQQQSSNLNATTSTRDLEKQVYIDVQKETDGFRSESPKLCGNMTTNLNQAEDNMQKNFGRTCMEGMRNNDVVKTQAMQMNIGNTEYNVSENRNGKANTRTDRYRKLRTKNDHDSAKATDSVNSSDSYKDYRREGKVSTTKGVNCIEDSLILNGGDLKINERPPPTPEPSIHVDMNEYSSDEDSEKVKRSSKVGWTFYNNVLGQVNHLLQNSCVVDDQQQNQTKANQTERNETENKAVLDTVKNATLEQLKKLGISLNENPEVKELNNSNKMAFDLSFYPRLDYQANMTQATSAVNETNTSMHMKALALKYLSDEQLAELAVQKQGSTSLKHLMVSNVQGTNMSFATMRYLERYQLLPGKNGVQAEDMNKIPVETPPKNDLKVPNSKNSPKVLQRFPFNQTPKTSCPSKILDISTLKQQPKLL